MPAAQIDAGSRYGPMPAPQKTMHSQFGDGDEVLKQRKEAQRLSSRSQRKWMEAAEKGEMRRIEQLLEDGQDINEVCDPSKSTALYVAARTDNCRLAELLLKKGADPAVTTNDLVTPAWIAISRGAWCVARRCCLRPAPRSTCPAWQPHQRARAQRRF